MKIQKLNIDFVNNLKQVFREDNVYWKTSSYIGRRFYFKTNTDWIETLCSYHKNFLEQLIKIICESNPIDTEYKINNNLSKGDIKVLRRCYFTVYRNLDEYEIALDYKRPFGNSDVICDLLQCYELNGGDDIDKSIETYTKLLDDVIVKIKDFLTTHDFDENLEYEITQFGFKLSKSYIRKTKIKKLLS